MDTHERQLLAQCYQLALEAGDLTMVQSVLALAERDSHLESLLLEVNEKRLIALQGDFVQASTPKSATPNKTAPQNKRESHRTFWTAAAASLVTVLLGVVLVMSRIPQLQTLVVAPPVPVPSFTQHSLITSENIDQMQPFARLGNGIINQIYMMPDGEHLLVAASTGLFLHDAQDLNAEPEQIASESISYMDVDTQGNIFGVTSLLAGTDNPEQTVVRWDAVTNERHNLLQLPEDVDYIDDISVKPDGSQMMVQMCAEKKFSNDFGWICAKQEFAWFDTANSELLALDEPVIDGQLPGQYAIADNWSYIAYYLDLDGQADVYEFSLQLINIETREARTVLLSNAPSRSAYIVGGLNRLMLSADGQRLLLQTVGTAEQSSILDVDMLWNAAEPIDLWMSDDVTLYRTGKLENAFAFGYTFSPDGLSVVAASYGSLFRYNLTGDVNLSLQPALKTDSQGGDLYQTVVFTPDGQTMYALYAANIIIKYNASLEIVDTLTHYNSIHNPLFQFSADGQFLAVSSRFSSVPVIWTLNTDSPTNERFLPDGELHSVSLFALSPDGITVAYQDSDFWNEAPVWVDRLYDDNSRHLVDTDLQLHDLSFLPDGSLLGMRYQAGIVRYSVEDILNDNPQPQVDRLNPPGMVNSIFSPSGISRIALSPNSQWAVVTRCYLETTCTYTLFTVWSMETKDQITLVMDETAFKDYGSMSFSPDSQLFAYGYCNHELEVVNTEHSCASGEVRVYTIDSLLTHNGTFGDSPPLEPLLTLTGFEALPTNIAFNPVQQSDDSWLVAITELNTQTQLWRINTDGTSELLRTLENVWQSVAFDPIGGLMFTTSDTAQTEVWGVPLSEDATR
jgi:WD40 repeat protein